jgi:serine/threonine protein kinase
MPDSRPARKLEITLLQERSSGTFARVYMARARTPNGLTRIVAVKVLREKWSKTKEVLTRTQDEAQLLARLQHPHILRVEAITQVEGQPAIVMEFVHGADLGQLLHYLKNQESHYPFRTVYEIAERVMSALSAAYFKVPVGMAEPLRVVHRDIKPSNIMISAEGALKVLDFGTARFDAEERVARTEAIRFGSLKYMSSERRDGDRGDHSSDVYSLGLVLLELLHGDTLPSLPMDRASHDAQVQARISVLTDLGLPNEGWDASLRQTLSRMLSYDAEPRLDATQCVKLFRAFKEQAAGESLGAFAETVVSPMAGNVFAAPDDGKLTGAKFELDPSFIDSPSIEPDPPTETATPELSALAQLETRALPRELPAMPIGLRAETEEPPSATARPGYAFGNLSVDEVAALPNDLGPSPFRDGTGPIEATDRLIEPQLITQENISLGGLHRPPPPAAPPTQPAPARPGQSEPGRQQLAYGLLGCLGVSLLFGAAGAAAYTFFRVKQTAPPAPVETAGTTTRSVGLASISLRAGGPTVQSVRLFDSEGTRLINARPEDSASIPNGTYTLKVKVVARPTLSTVLIVKEDSILTCKPATMGQVKCTSGPDSPTLVLKP